MSAAIFTNFNIAFVISAFAKVRTISEIIVLHFEITLKCCVESFNEEYDFSFHVPKNDQCSICVSYNRGTETEQKKYYQPQQMKMRPREEEIKDKDFYSK